MFPKDRMCIICQFFSVTLSATILAHLAASLPIRADKIKKKCHRTSIGVSSMKELGNKIKIDEEE